LIHSPPLVAMRAQQLACECLVFGGCLAIGFATPADNTWLEVICGTVLTYAWLMMNGGSPLGWLVVVLTSCISDTHWIRFATAVTTTFGDVYDGYGGWAFGFIGYLIFVVFYIVHGLMLLPFDVWQAAHDRVQHLKIQPKFNMATKTTGKLLSALGINAIIVAVYLWFMTAQSVWTRGSSGYRFFSMDANAHQWNLPSRQEQLICFLAGLCWNEFMFYYVHRAMHHPRLYARLHKKHHEYSAPFALAAIYCGPIEMVLANLWPFLGVVSVFRFHGFFAYCWVANAVMGTQAHHSGYRWPWLSVTDHQPNTHDLHHEQFNVNFGNTGLLDKLHRTFRDPHEAHENRKSN